MVKIRLPVQEMQVRSLGQEDLLEKEWQPTPMFSPGELHGQRSLAGYSPGAFKRVRHNLATEEQESEMVKGTIKGY